MSRKTNNYSNSNAKNKTTTLDGFLMTINNNNNNNINNNNTSSNSIIIESDDDDINIDEVINSSPQQSVSINYNINLTPTKNKSYPLRLPSKAAPKFPLQQTSQSNKTSTITTTAQTPPTTPSKTTTTTTIATTTPSTTTKTKPIDVPPTQKYAFQENFKKKSVSAPLAEIMRPNEFIDFIGQDDLLNEKSITKQLFKSNELPSFIFYGPSGCGKTTLVNIIASKATNYHFVSLSAVGTGIKDLNQVIEKAKGSLQFGKKTILFVDEIHRYSKVQQDVLLPAVECGVVVLIGATTENPSFELNSALLSRCKVFRMEKLNKENIVTLIKRTLEMIPLIHENKRLVLDDDTIEKLAEIADGDARYAINSLDMAIKAYKNDQSYKQLQEDKASGAVRDILITKESLGQLLQKSNLLMDKGGDNFYELISALHKSVRGSDANASAYYIVRMLESGCEPLYIARRMIRMASEDIGLADNHALPLATAAFQAVQFVGMPECSASLLQCAVYLAQAPKSNSMDHWYESTKKYLANNASPPVPIHLRNAPTKLMRSWNYGADYQYNHAFDDQSQVTQTYLPDSIKEETFFEYKLTHSSNINQQQNQQASLPLRTGNTSRDILDLNPTLLKKQKTTTTTTTTLDNSKSPIQQQQQNNISINTSSITIDGDSDFSLEFNDDDFDITSITSATTTPYLKNENIIENNSTTPPTLPTQQQPTIETDNNNNDNINNEKQEKQE